MNRMIRILGGARGPARMVSMAALLASGLLLAGCGQKGPLYLPPPGQATPVVAPVMTPGAVVAPHTPPEVVVPR